MLKQLLRVSALAASAVSSLCMAQSAPASNPWSGAWKVELPSQYFDGATYHVVTDATGYTISQGGKPMPKMDCTGKPVTNPSGSVSTCTKTAEGYSVATTRDGKPRSVTVLSVSKDGKKMTRAGHFTPDGDAPYTVTTSFSRVGMGKSLDGEWKQTGFVESQETGILHIDVTGDSISFQETDSPKAFVCKLDGTPTVIPGSGKISITLADPHTLKVRYLSAKDELGRENTFILSLDGKMISETDFTPDPTPSGMTQLFHKM